MRTNLSLLLELPRTTKPLNMLGPESVRREGRVTTETVESTSSNSLPGESRTALLDSPVVYVQGKYVDRGARSEVLVSLDASSHARKMAIRESGSARTSTSNSLDSLFGNF